MAQVKGTDAVGGGSSGARRNGGDNTTPTKPRQTTPVTQPTPAPTPTPKPRNRDSGSSGNNRNNNRRNDKPARPDYTGNNLAQQLIDAAAEKAKNQGYDLQKRWEVQNKRGADLLKQLSTDIGRQQERERQEIARQNAQNIRDKRNQREEIQKQMWLRGYGPKPKTNKNQGTKNTPAGIGNFPGSVFQNLLNLQGKPTNLDNPGLPEPYGTPSAEGIKDFSKSVFQNLLNLQGKPTNLDNPGLPEPYTTPQGTEGIRDFLERYDRTRIAGIKDFLGLNPNNPPSTTPTSNSWPLSVDISGTIHPEDIGLDVPRTDPNYPNYYRWGTDYGAGKYLFHDNGDGDDDDDDGGGGGGGGGGHVSGGRRTAGDAAYDIATVKAQALDALAKTLPQGFEYSFPWLSDQYWNAFNSGKVAMDQTAQRMLNNWDDNALPTIQAIRNAMRLNAQSGNTTGASRGVQAANNVQGVQTSVDAFTKQQQELYAKALEALMQYDTQQASIPGNVSNTLNQIGNAWSSALGNIFGYYLYGDVASANNNNQTLGPNDLTSALVNIAKT